MITLMIKESPKGLKYLCKTVKEDYECYVGSGTRWLRHINKHKLIHSDISTEVILRSEDLEEISKVALKLSFELNVVESTEWANLIPEDCKTGHLTKEHWSTEFINKHSDSMSGENHPNFGKNPWETTSASKQGVPEIWKLAADVYDWWVLQDTSKRYGHSYTFAARYFGYKPSMTWRNILNWIKANGNPNDNIQWRNWSNEQ